MMALQSHYTHSYRHVLLAGCGVDRGSAQEVKVQERVSELAVGTIPRSLWVLLHDDLVEACQAGDDVIVCGQVGSPWFPMLRSCTFDLFHACLTYPRWKYSVQVIRRWMPLKADIRSDLDTVILANHIKVINARHQGLAITPELKAEFAAFWAENASTPFVGRNKILASVCPQVYGLYVVKLAVLMVLVGGVPRRTEGGTRIRGESHMLLVGDPGIGPTTLQFLLCFPAQCASPINCRLRIVSRFARGTFC
jgi:DNA helicase MCM9